ncbi:MAG: hypothetical protein KHZ58_14310 [Hungatella hathewayi]|nr:hypothetical protein [Hungatella hathewayi]
MQSCEFVLSISALACAIAKDKTPEELGLMAAAFSQLGDTLATIAAQDALCAPETGGGAKQAGGEAPIH